MKVVAVALVVAALAFGGWAAHTVVQAVKTDLAVAAKRCA